MDFVSIPISIISLAVSAGTFWVVFLRRGKLKMTTPTIVFFGYDHTPNPTAKVFVRTLLYCTAAKGVVIEAMHASAFVNGKEHKFSFWGYGETEKLTAGSGLHISQSGFSANHHFVDSVLNDPYTFVEGNYTIEVYAKVVGRRKRLKLDTIKIEVSGDLTDKLTSFGGVLFERTIEGDYRGNARSRNG